MTKTASPTPQERASAVHTARKPRDAWCKYCGFQMDNPRPNQLFCQTQERLAWWRQARAEGRPHLCACGKLHHPRKAQPRKPKVRHVCIAACPGCRG